MLGGGSGGGGGGGGTPPIHPSRGRADEWQRKADADTAEYTAEAYMLPSVSEAGSPVRTHWGGLKGGGGSSHQGSFNGALQAEMAGAGVGAAGGGGEGPAS